MKRLHRISVLAILLALGISGNITALQDVPGDQIVVLRNGEVFRGSVSRSSGKVAVRLSSGGTVSLEGTEVAFQCDNLQQAYQRLKSEYLSGKTEQHLWLARWCLRYGYLAGTEQQIQLLQSSGYGGSTLAILQAQLDTARTTGANLPPGQHAAPSDETPGSHATRAPTRLELDRLVEQLPEGAFVAFTQYVQPRLVNNCTTSGCHTSADSTFRLFRFGRGDSVPRGMAQRNLHATLEMTDRTNPDQSKLLQMAVVAHGPMSEPVFDTTSIHYLMIRDWILALSGRAPEGAVAQSQSPAASLPDSTGGVDHTTSPSAPPDVPSPTNPLERTTYRPKDPFDPEVFNRMHFPDRYKKEG